jgi:glycosyltransferase involved in cell wall biosynthesis
MKFSVIIPTYNRRHQISQAIDSVLAQEGIELEIIIVDDGSIDGTVEWLPQAYPDPRIRVLSNNRKKGPAGARNTGLLAATGDCVALLDSDDCFLPYHLASCQAILSIQPEVGLVFGRALYEQNGQPVDFMGPNFNLKLALATPSQENGDYIVFADDYFTHLLQFGCYFNLSTVAIRSQIAKALMNEELRIAEDYEFWVRLSRTSRFACLKAPQIRYQIHDQNISFEASSTAADNAPHMIKAYKIMLDYPNLNAAQIGFINAHLASVLFDWGYRCRQQNQIGEAIKKHIYSIRYGMKAQNLASLLKLFLLTLIPGQKAGR